MGKDKIRIQTTSYVHVGDDLIPVHLLDEKGRGELATWIKETYLNEIFVGRAEFYRGKA